MRLTYGKIGAIPSFPVQIHSRELGGLLSCPVEDSIIGRWIIKELSGFNLQEVVCVNEEQTGERYIQFRVPSSSYMLFSKSYVVDEKCFLVDLALPIAAPLGPRMGPPCERTVHEHWKLSIRQNPTSRIGHANVIEKIENCPGSFQRFFKMRDFF